jgi:acid stress-induced BolA-like protein IbaG/YrbA
MNEADIEQLMSEANKYPIGLRIAAKILDAGITEEQFHNMPSLRQHQVMYNNVANYIRNIKTDRAFNVPKDKKLSQLANKL